MEIRIPLWLRVVVFPLWRINLSFKMIFNVVIKDDILSQSPRRQRASLPTTVTIYHMIFGPAELKISHVLLPFSLDPKQACSFHLVSDGYKRPEY